MTLWQWLFASSAAVVVPAALVLAWLAPDFITWPGERER